jgi:hypothetical protein
MGSTLVGACRGLYCWWTERFGMGPYAFGIGAIVRGKGGGDLGAVGFATGWWLAARDVAAFVRGGEDRGRRYDWGLAVACFTEKACEKGAM